MISRNFREWIVQSFIVIRIIESFKPFRYHYSVRIICPNSLNNVAANSLDSVWAHSHFEKYQNNKWIASFLRTSKQCTRKILLGAYNCERTEWTEGRFKNNIRTNICVRLHIVTSKIIFFFHLIFLLRKLHHFIAIQKPMTFITLGWRMFCAVFFFELDLKFQVTIVKEWNFWSHQFSLIQHLKAWLLMIVKETLKTQTDLERA